MNRIFDALIDQIDEQEKILFAVRGRWQAYVEINGFAGVSSLILPPKKPYSQPQNHVEWRGRSLKDLAARIRSEEPDEAALGCAALNAWYN